MTEPTMFLKVQKSPMLYLQHKDMDPVFITPVTSTLQINMNHVAEVSIYTIKEETVRKTLDQQDVTVPVGTHVIHMVMSYTHSTHAVNNAANPHTVNQRYYYKLVFFPGADAEFLRIKQILNKLTYE